MKWLTTAVIALSIGLLAYADSEQIPYPYVSATIDGAFHLKMIPDPDDIYNKAKGRGVVFQVTAGKDDKILWRTTGWYSFQTYLSHDGKYLVRIDDWIPGEMPSSYDIAVVFYKEGKPINSFSTKDLIVDGARLRKSMSHYQCIEKVVGFKGYSHDFVIRLIDGKELVFDVKKGIVRSKTPSQN